MLGSVVAYIGSKDSSDLQENVQDNTISSGDIRYEQGNTCQSPVLSTYQNSSKNILNHSEIERLKKKSEERLKIAYEKKARYWHTPDPENVKRLMKEYNATEYVIVTDGLTESQVNKALNVLKAAGIKVSTTTSERLSTTGLECGRMYNGVVDVHNHDTVYWFYHLCWWPYLPWFCTKSQPSESSGCDIHYEAFMNFDGYYTRGLIDFPGCKPAQNCGGPCGAVNTLKFGICVLTYDDLPLSVPDFTISAQYTLTTLDNCQHCDCYTEGTGLCDDYPQVMVTDFRGVII